MSPFAMLQAALVSRLDREELESPGESISKLLLLVDLDLVRATFG